MSSIFLYTLENIWQRLANFQDSHAQRLRSRTKGTKHFSSELFQAETADKPKMFHPTLKHWDRLKSLSTTVVESSVNWMTPRQCIFFAGLQQQKLIFYSIESSLIESSFFSARGTVFLFLLRRFIFYSRGHISFEAEAYWRNAFDNILNEFSHFIQITFFPNINRLNKNRMTSLIYSLSFILFIK